MKIYLTTRGRVRDQKTLMRLPADIRQRVVMVVQDRDWLEHWQEWRAEVAEVRALPKWVTRLGPTRKVVYEWREEKKITLLDDDLEFYIRQDPDDWHLTSPGYRDMHDMFELVDCALDRYMHVSISGREGNNRVEEYSVENVRYMRWLSYRTDHPSHVRHGRIDGCGDFDVNLQLLRSGHPSLVFYRFAQGQPGTQMPGGCSLDRTMIRHEREVDWMCIEHAPFVKKVQKRNVSGGEFGTRPEVQVAWKDAYLSSKLAPGGSSAILVDEDTGDDDEDIGAGADQAW